MLFDFQLAIHAGYCHSFTGNKFARTHTRHRAEKEPNSDPDSGTSEAQARELVHHKSSQAIRAPKCINLINLCSLPDTSPLLDGPDVMDAAGWPTSSTYYWPNQGAVIQLSDSTALCYCNEWTNGPLSLSPSSDVCSPCRWQTVSV